MSEENHILRNIDRLSSFFDSEQLFPQFERNYPPPRSLLLFSDSFSFLQLDFFNKKETILSVLNNEQDNLALLLQEPWVYTHNFLPPIYHNWHRILSVQNPLNRSDKPRKIIYIRKTVPSQFIHTYNYLNNLLTFVTIVMQ